MFSHHFWTVGCFLVKQKPGLSPWMVVTSKFWMLAGWLERSSLLLCVSGSTVSRELYSHSFNDFYCVVFCPFHFSCCDHWFCLMALLYFLTSLKRDPSCRRSWLRPASHLVVLISDPFPSVNAMFFDEMSLMITEPKYLKKIWNVMIFNCH